MTSLKHLTLQSPLLRRIGKVEEKVSLRDFAEKLPLEHLVEAATGGGLWKKLFFKISQYSQESICAGVSF